MLGLAYTTVHQYVTDERIRGIRVADVILIPIEEVKNFKPNIAGRPRTTIPQWHISPNDNALLYTSIHVRVRKGKRDAFRERLDIIKREKEHQLPGTIARYVLGSTQDTEQVEIVLVWRISVMPDEAIRQQALEAFKQALADMVDWSTARFDEGTVMMHA